MANVLHPTDSDISQEALDKTFIDIQERLKKWQKRFKLPETDGVFSELATLFLLSQKSFLNHRNSTHLFRILISLHYLREKLRHQLFSEKRTLHTRWLSTRLDFPFSSKSVLACLVALKKLNRYELLDESNVQLILQKYYPHLQLVQESCYYHHIQDKECNLFYFEIERIDGKPLSHNEKRHLRQALTQKLKECVESLSPTIFMRLNKEEIYKNILVLSKEIIETDDIPRAIIHLDHQNNREIVFRVTLVYLPAINQAFKYPSLITEHEITVKHIDNQPVVGHVFRIPLPKEASLLRADSSIDFYSARAQIVRIIQAAIGNFHDYNGGLLIAQQQLLNDFKEQFPHIDKDLLEKFFYNMLPLEKQTVLSLDVLIHLFEYFQENRQNRHEHPYILNIHYHENCVFLNVYGSDLTLKKTVLSIMQEDCFIRSDVAYNVLECADTVYFNCVILKADAISAEPLIQTLHGGLNDWEKQKEAKQILNVALSIPVYSLDPRIGGEVQSGSILRLLFAGLTRSNQTGQIENAIAESIEISSDLKNYIFRLRPSLWNDGSQLTAYDFEYAWKKILSPQFKASFASYFYPIKNAKEVKEGLLPMESLGISVIDDLTLKVQLTNPAPYFLELVAHPLYSPIHRHIDQQSPQWIYTKGNQYPCNGPYQLKENHHSRGYELIQNPYYWNAGTISLDQINFVKLSPRQAVEAFQKEEINWIGNPFSNWEPEYGTIKKAKKINLPNSFVCWLVLNTKRTPFTHTKMRQAIAYAIKRAEIISECYIPLTAAYSPLQPHYHKNRLKLFPEQDKQQAIQLRDQALKELGISLEQLPRMEFIYAEQGIRQPTALCLKQQLKECLGIECTLKPMGWKNLFKDILEGNFDLGLMQWTAVVDDPIYTLHAFKSSSEEINFPKWEHPDFKNYLDLSEQAVNPFQRSSYLLSAEQLLCQEMPVIPLFYQSSYALVKENFEAIFKQRLGPFLLEKSYFK